MNTVTQQERRITVIPADPQFTERDIQKKHLRVAAYCRVSTDSEEQLNSYNAQITYYTEKIAATPEWTMVRLYADEGITGTSMKRRKEFLKMLRDCDRGKIDLIITKSVSRFGRNTLDGLDTVRRLETQGDRRLLRKGERQHPLHGQRDDPRLHDEPGTGGERVSQRQCEMGPPEKFQGWQGLLPLRQLPRLPQGSGRPAGDRPR